MHHLFNMPEVLKPEMSDFDTKCVNEAQTSEVDYNSVLKLNVATNYEMILLCDWLAVPFYYTEALKDLLFRFMLKRNVLLRTRTSGFKQLSMLPNEVYYGFIH